MELKPTNPTAKGPAQNFAGDVYVTPVYSGQEPSRMTVALVRFIPGAHTNWHRHAVGQTLHGLLNVNGFFTLLLEWLDHVVGEGLLKRKHRDLLIVSDSIPGLLDQLAGFVPPPPVTTWLEPVRQEEYEAANQQ